MKSSKASAIERAILESLKAWRERQDEPLADRHDLEAAARMTVAERLQLMNELSRRAARLSPGPVRHEPIRGKTLLLGFAVMGRET